MEIKDYEKIELEFEDYSIILPISVIEKFQVQKGEQLIEEKYNPEDEYNVYIVINRILAEEIWKEEATKKFERDRRSRMDRNTSKYRWYAKIWNISWLY